MRHGRRAAPEPVAADQAIAALVRCRDVPSTLLGPDRIDPCTLTIALDDLLPAERVVAVDSGDSMGHPSVFPAVPDEFGSCSTQAPQSVGPGGVAVLDTGVDAAHPGLARRALTATSLVAGESPRDGHGHGTHCVGTACGPRAPPRGSRGHGVAPDAEVFVGTVLSDEGSGTDAEILAGIARAARNGCQVISMSLGPDVAEPSPACPAAGRRALEQGSLIVAAAGDNADRGNGDPRFVGVPANSPDILAVGALDPFLAVARDLWWELSRAARRLIAPSADVGAGIPLAPR